MAKKNYDALASQLLGAVGGKENVSNFAHCATRLRFILKDKTGVEAKDLKTIPGVIDAQWSGEQMQVIIGPDVENVYNAICALGDFERQSALQSSTKKGPRKISFGAIIGAIADCFIPLIPAMCACGLLKVILILGSAVGLIAENSGTYQVLTFVGDTAFYFMPIFVGASAAKRFNCSMALGMLIGGIMLNPTYVSLVDAGDPLTIFGLPIQLVKYNSTLLPCVAAVFVLSYVERFFKRHTPEIVRGFVAPMCTMLIMLPMTMCLIGPLGILLGNYVSAALIWLYNTLGFVGVAVVAMLFPLLVMTGMQKSLIPYLATSFATMGYESFMLPASYISNVTQAIAGFAVGFKTRNPEIKSIAFSTAFTAVFGPTEPVMYGINLRYKIPLYCALAGNAVGGAIAGLGHVASHVMGGGSGILIITTYFPGGMANVIWLVAATVVASIITFVSTFILYKDQEDLPA